MSAICTSEVHIADTSTQRRIRTAGSLVWRVGFLTAGYYGFHPGGPAYGSDGREIVNVYPYSLDGQPLDGVLLYDQDGIPINAADSYNRPPGDAPIPAQPVPAPDDDVRDREVPGAASL